MEYIGLDVHKQYTVACIINREDGEVRHVRLNNRRQEFEKLFDCPDQQRAVLEASGSSYMVYDLIEDLLSEVQVANPSQVKAIANAAVKTDKIDSQTLAHLLSADLIPRCHVRNRQNREAIYQLRQRMYLVRLRSSVKNRIHALISRQAEDIRLKSPAGSDLFGKAGRQWLERLELPATEAKMLNNLLKLLSSLDDLIKESDGWIRDLYRADPVVQRLASIPGIGKFLSVLIRFEIDDIERFKDQSKLLAYAGLVPTTSSSGGKTRHGKQIKSSNHWLRWGLIEAVWPAITTDPWLRSIYTRKKKHKHTNVAKSILAKKLLMLVYKVWKEGRNYLPVQPLQASQIVGQP
jgi:transposase